MKDVGVVILGGTGYGAGELLRILCAHPRTEVVSVVSSSEVGKPFHIAHSNLLGFYSQNFEAEPNWNALKKFKYAVLVSALPNGASSKALAGYKNQIIDGGVKVIDLSGDYRLNTPALQQEFYPEAARDKVFEASAVYGLTELNREKISGANFIANPGCLATAAILALAPLSKDISGLVAIDTKTGSTGSGRKLGETTHHPARHSNYRAYKPLAHQHEPEVLQALGDPAGERIKSSFIAQSLPVARGIFVTAHAELKTALEQKALEAKFAAFYEGSPFVRFRKGSPELRDVVGTNFCDVSLHVRGKQVVLMTAIDNLLKGMVGQAVQNMNLMCGGDERDGLWFPSLGLL